MDSSSSSATKLPSLIETKPVKFSQIAITEFPSGREGHCACSIGEKLYIFGGVCQSVDDDCAESSDLITFDSTQKSSTWTKVDALGDIPPPRSAAVLNAVGKKLYLFGGLSQYYGWFDDVHVFDIETLKWSKLETGGSSPRGRDKLASAVIGEKIYYFGGFGPKGVSDGLLEDDEDDEDYEDIDDDDLQDVKQQQTAADFGWFNDLYILDTVSKTWSQPMQLNLGVPTMRAAHGMCALGQNLVIFGGRDPVGRQNDIHIFDTVTRKWQIDIKEQGYPPDRRSFHTVTKISENLALIFGGRSESNSHFNDCHIFNIGNLTWYKVPGTGKVPPARGCHSCNVLSGKVIIYAGSSEFIPEIQHCQVMYNDAYTAEVSDFIEVVNDCSAL